MRTGLAVAGILLVVGGGYLSFWPVPIEPVAWQAPTGLGYVGPFERNDYLRAATGIDIGVYEGPEDATVGADGLIYVTTADGTVIQVGKSEVKEFVKLDGRPLGIETDQDGSFVIANSHIGIQRISSDGAVTTILDTIDGKPLVSANNLAIGLDSTIYFSQSSSKFGAGKYESDYDASLVDLLEHGGNGAVFMFDAKAGTVTRLLSGLNYANGVAISEDGSFILVAETGHYRILKYWLTGEQKGVTEVLLENLPGFPDNIKRGTEGRFWIGLAAPRNQLLDSVSDKPFLRKVIQRLPAFLRPKAEPFSHVIAINGDGDVVMNMHDPDARFPTLTGVLETPDALYLTTIFGGYLPRIDKHDRD